MSPPAAARARAFDALDDEDVQAAFTEARESAPGRPGRLAYLAIEGMTCAACAQIIRNALEDLPGVLSIDINTATGAARLHWNPNVVRLSAVFERIAAAGYQPFPADDYQAQAQRRSARKTLLWQFLVALLAMMQTMMYAWPGYVAEPGDLSPDIVRLFNWAAWIMCLPVLLFSSRPFFAGAWSGLRLRSVSMDLPVAIGIAVTFVASSVAMYSGGETYFDSMTMFVTFLLGGRLWEGSLRERIGRELSGLTRRLPVTVERLDGQAQRVAVHRLNVGDRIRVAVGEAVPADGLVLSGRSSLDESVLTGEARPVLRCEGDTVLSGSFNLSAPLVVCVTGLGRDSRYGQIVELMERAASERPAIVRTADRYAQWFLFAVLGLALLAGLGWWWAGSPRALWIAVSVLIVTCPCALSLAAPMSLLAAVNRLLGAGVLVARPAALEAFASAQRMVFDKTGTLTESDLQLSEVRVLRTGLQAADVLAIAAALEASSLHPVARAIRVAAGDRTPLPVEGLRETVGVGVFGCVGGRDYRLGRPTLAEAVHTASEGTDRDDDRDTDSIVELSDDNGVLARLHLQALLRADARQTLPQLAADGLKLSLLSGDREPAVRALADSLGIADWRADALPEDKYRQAQAWQAQGERLVFVGDGVNDAPVLGASDVSVAMGAAAPIAQSRADFVLLRDRLGDLMLTRQVSKATMHIIRQNLAWAFAYNMVCVPLAMVGWMPPWLAGLGMAASSILVLLNSTRLLRGNPPASPSRKPRPGATRTLLGTASANPAMAGIVSTGPDESARN